MAESPVIVEERAGPIERKPTGFRATRFHNVKAASQRAALQVAGLPQPGFIWSDHRGNTLNAFVVAIRQEVTILKEAPPGGLGLYRIETEYGVPVNTDREPEPGGPAIANWDTVMETVPMDTALDVLDLDAGQFNVPVVNGLGEPFDPPPTRERKRGILILRWIPEQPINKLEFAPLEGTLNKEEFMGILTNQGRLMRLPVETRSDGFQEVSMRVEWYDPPDDWQVTLLDADFGGLINYNRYFEGDWSVIPIPTSGG